MTIIHAVDDCLTTIPLPKPVESPMPDSLHELAEQLDRFASERDWQQFHSPKNLASALVVEAGEPLKHFQWYPVEKARGSSRRHGDLRSAGNARSGGQHRSRRRAPAHVGGDGVRPGLRRPRLLRQHGRDDRRVADRLPSRMEAVAGARPADRISGAHRPPGRRTTLSFALLPPPQ